MGNCLYYLNEKMLPFDVLNKILVNVSQSKTNLADQHFLTIIIIAFPGFMRISVASIKLK